MSNNPLAKHFRQPAIYMSLPSGGKYWPAGSLDLNLSGKLGVMPMTIHDEIVLKTPDALLSGEGVVKIIQSCCPQIKDAWNMPSIDLDSVLIAIRIASYGQNLDIDTNCPACNHENNHEMDLTTVLDGVRSPNYNVPVEVDNLKIYTKPQSYFESNKANMIDFEEQRIMQIVSDTEMSDQEKNTKYTERMLKLHDLTINVIVEGTDYVVTEDGVKVDDKEFIREFYTNADNKIIYAVRKKLADHAEAAALPKPFVNCSECDHRYSVDIEFNYSNFFAASS